MKKFLLPTLVCVSLPCIAFSSQETVKIDKSQQEEVSATEDLMREHGILNRLLLIFQEIAKRIDNFEQFDIESLAKSAN